MYGYFMVTSQHLHKESLDIQSNIFWTQKRHAIQSYYANQF